MYYKHIYIYICISVVIITFREEDALRSSPAMRLALSPDLCEVGVLQTNGQFP